MAIDYYTKAIDLNPSVAAYYGNRSIAYLKTEGYGYALRDASKALDLDNKYIKVRWIFPFPINEANSKYGSGLISWVLIEGVHHNIINPNIQGYYRRATANMAVGKFKQALKDFEAVVKVRPRDKDAMAKFTECNKIVRQIAFEKAIAVESCQKKPSESIDLDTIGMILKMNPLNLILLIELMIVDDSSQVKIG